MSQTQPFGKHLPNLLTLCNLAVGLLSTIMAFENHLLFAAWLILLAAVLDFLDGLTAKLLDAISDFGRQLDSLADVISFGMAPAAIVYMLMEYSLKNQVHFTGISGANLLERIFLFSPMLIVLFAAIRLADFNVQKDKSYFSGLATPAAAIFFAGLGFIVITQPESGFSMFLLNPAVLLVTVLIICILMIVRIPMFSLKFSGFGWAGNEIRYSFIAVSVILLIILQEIALPVIILVYLLLSIILLLIKTDINNSKNLNA
jgi:CDP-diacylglycerol--serine O-phosphatidyltransferase